jgi:septal ring factor EnvC (AmiA/AmiB activator)
MARRAIALYKTGQVGPVRALFSSNSLREVLERSSTLRFLIEYDASLAERFQRDYLAYEAARGDAEKATRRNEAAADRLGREQAALERERRSKSDVLRVARRDRALERAILVELEKAAHALETTLAELGRAERKHGEWVDGSGFGARRGALPLPVRARIAARFGKVVDAEFLTATFRTGIEFAAPAGKRVRAVSKGEVRFAGWFRGYGKIVILDHGDEYFTISGHLSEIDVEVGDRVREGSAIGRVGDTGSLAGPLLYFELRRGGEPIDPTGWFAPDRLAEAG